MFGDEEDYKKKNLIILIIIIIILISSLITYSYYQLKPLPNVKECEKEGFIGGKYLNNKVYCFKDCNNNHLEDCKTVKVLV